MKNLFLAALTTVALGSAAHAGSITFSIPNLTFPPTSDVTVGKDCLPQTATPATCLPQG
ncbi:hypothetical protein L0664_11605 [Octadecabacter sp. G9-8]|uniref:Uncharacterized protein n=1 Tax=Octadecabacter dasysiphoniae TaxID=2909341 RepID=A0ABS9D079_9RHOB|nr:hypothetical protein [Octadecabacter dasysiphoniae]MCF2871713.1 hypothetical protein [Octadecabacter dasysiphoniae]